jgi:hypothetical protein
MPSTEVDDFVIKPTSINHLKDVILRHIGNTKKLLRGRALMPLMTGNTNCSANQE